MQRRQNLAIALAANNAYIHPLKVVIASLLKHKKPQTAYQIYLLAYEFLPENQAALAQVLAEHDAQGSSSFTYLPISQMDEQRFPLFKTVDFGGGWGKESLYRLLLPSYLAHEQRVLYLDADVLVQDDLSALALMDLSNKALAGVLDAIHFDAYGHLTMHSYRFAKLEGLSDEQYQQAFAQHDYFNSGVLLLNLDYWREHQLDLQMIALLKRTYEQGSDYIPVPKPGFAAQEFTLTWEHLLYPDQDVLNYVLGKRNRQEVAFLPNTYNLSVEHFHQNTPLTHEQPAPYPWLRHLRANALVEQRNLIDLNPKIWHFHGANKPWHRLEYPLAALYQQYAKLVGWEIAYLPKKRPNWLKQLIKAFLPYALVRYWQKS